MNCLICYKELSADENDYHSKCVYTAFGMREMPSIDIDENKLSKYAKEILSANTAITGVQPKLSLWLEESKKNVRFTIIDNKSNYIIKPQSDTFASLPENEDLCMHLANQFGIETAKHGLVRLPSDKLAYLTKRFERLGDKKLACEDLCQLTETLTEHKYRGSYEKTGKVIQQYSTQSGLDSIKFFETIVFCFIIGNADMHLKNFSMLERNDGQFSLSPVYDLVSTYLVISSEPEQMSLTLNGRKNKLVKNDFDILGKSLNLNEKQIINTYQTFSKNIDKAFWWIKNSFLSDNQKDRLIKLVTHRVSLLIA